MTIALVAAVLLFRFRMPVLRTLAVCALLGLLGSAVSGLG